jgi:hypothetical protein
MHFTGRTHSSSEPIDDENTQSERINFRDVRCEGAVEYLDFVHRPIAFLFEEVAHCGPPFRPPKHAPPSTVGTSSIKRPSCPYTAKVQARIGASSCKRARIRIRRCQLLNPGCIPEHADRHRSIGTSRYKPVLRTEATSLTRTLRDRGSTGQVKHRNSVVRSGSNDVGSPSIQNTTE